jgi:hypothetical protein
MATVNVETWDDTAALSTAQTGTGDSTNVAKRNTIPYTPGALVITSTVGATPTVTVNIMGSVDGTNYFNIPYSLAASARTFVTTAITITTAVTSTYFLQELVPWNYVKLVYSANTNVTLTATVWV